MNAQAAAQPQQTDRGTDQQADRQARSGPIFLELSPASGRRVDPLQEIPRERREARSSRPWLFSNMITSLDGATSVDGLSEGLGGPSDRQVFRGLRLAADAIIVGSKTVSDERYRPARPNSLGIQPAIVVVTSRLQLSFDLPLFEPSEVRPIIATTDSITANQRAALEPVADIIATTSIGGAVDLHQLLGELAARGFQRVLLEGGPALNGHFIAENLIDEWNLTLSPVLVGGNSSRSAHGASPTELQHLKLRRLWQSEGLLFGRWTRPDHSDELAALDHSGDPTRLS